MKALDLNYEKKIMKVHIQVLGWPYKYRSLVAIKIISIVGEPLLF